MARHAARAANPGAVRPVPDRDSAEWWRAVERHELVVQVCDRCGTLRFPARAHCPRCRVREWHWRQVSPAGRVASWIVNHQPFLPGYPTPYTVVMVRLEDAPDCVMFGDWLEDREPEPGERVRPVFTVRPAPGGELFTLVDWEPVRP